MQDAVRPVISVSELNRLARLALERGLPSAWIAGEISNLTRAGSGHWYFSLKDSGASVRCAMFRNRNQFLDWQPGNGMQVEVRAQATLYEPRGEFQLTVDAMRRAGLGALFEAFQRLKERLAGEGLFDTERKRDLPAYPHRIGVVTSPQAAALRDVLSTLARRWPASPVILYPTPVQGEGAAARIADAVRLAGARREVDVLLLVRGGGSLEDLWSFNEEIVARAVAECAIPLVSGVGHETDFTIADFVADVRAPTPTGAASLASPDRAELLARLQPLHSRLARAMPRRLGDLAQRLDGIGARLRHPASRLEAQGRQLRQLAQRLERGMQSQLQQARRAVAPLAWRLRASAPRPGAQIESIRALEQRLARAGTAGMRRRHELLATWQAHLTHLDPRAVLARGYSIVRDASGRVLRDSASLKPEDAVSITLAHGGAEARITALR
jgi:exodeoxyribonuclease VII large subunit